MTTKILSILGHTNKIFINYKHQLQAQGRVIRYTLGNSNDCLPNAINRSVELNNPYKELRVISTKMFCSRIGCNDCPVQDIRYLNNFKESINAYTKDT